MQKALFIDRDGVINKDKAYVYKKEDFTFLPLVFKTLKKAQDLGYKLFIVTNQSGIGRGYYTKEEFLSLNSWMLDEFKKEKIQISCVKYCPHAPEENCKCRKPQTLMIEQIQKEFNIDLENSWLIGDKHSDIKCAINAGILNTIQVKSGKTFNEDESLAMYVLEDISEILKYI